MTKLLSAADVCTLDMVPNNLFIAISGLEEVLVESDTSQELATHLREAAQLGSTSDPVCKVSGVVVWCVSALLILL